MKSSEALPTRPTDLPEWERPPLDEVAIAVQFQETGLRSVHVAKLQELFGAQGLPTVEEQSNLIEQKFEVFGSHRLQFEPFFMPLERLPLPRCWFLSPDRHKLVQIQQDRFVFNWRKLEGAGEYPRFDAIYSEFAPLWAAFEEFLISTELGQPKVNQYELSYFNNITMAAGESFASAFARIFTLIGHPPSDIAVRGAITRPENLKFGMSWLVSPAEDGSPLGRLHADAIPAAVQGGATPIVRLTLTMRGPASADMASFFSTGRESIVRVFNSITSEECHREWGRKVAKGVN